MHGANKVMGHINGRWVIFNNKKKINKHNFFILSPSIYFIAMCASFCIKKKKEREIERARTTKE
jgi:hypothetical protein